MPTADPHVLFLLAAMLTADADASGPSLDKQRAMDAVLQKRLPGLTAQQRWDQVASALRGKTTFGGGVAFLRAVEKSGRAAASGMKRDTAKCYQLIKQLSAIAESDGAVSTQELHVLRAATSSLGMGRKLRITSTEATITIAMA